MRTLNLGILAHVDAGKTSLTERLLFTAGAIDAIGSVDAGTSTTDTLALERARGITIKTAVAAFALGDVAVNLIDTPGHPDFIAEVERVLAVLDGAVLVISAVEGVQAQTRVLMRTLRRLKIPTLIFVNKIDRAGAQVEPTLQAIAAALTPAIVGMGSVRGPGARAAAFLPFGAADAAFRARLAELLAESDDALLAAFLADRRPPYHRLRAALAAQTKAARAHPVFFGSAITGAGVEALMAALTEFLPTGAGDIDGPVSGVVFKVERGPGGERIAFLRLFGGAVRIRDRLVLRGTERKVTAMAVFYGGAAPSSPLAGAGRIARLWGLGDVRIGDTIGVPPRAAPEHHFAPPSLETLVVPRRGAERGVLLAALSQLAEQDPLINLRQDDIRGDIFVSLYGEVQKEVIAETLASDYGLAVDFRETITLCIERPVGVGAALIETPRPFIATVGLRVEPAPLGAGVEFASEVETGFLPNAFREAVEQSATDTLRQGLKGWPVSACRVTMTHAIRLRHWATSTPAEHRLLTPLVVMRALKEAGTVVCEPIHAFRLEIPADVLGLVSQVLARLGAAVHASAPGKSCALEGEIPAARVHALRQALPALTRGEAVLENVFDHHRPVRGAPPARPRTDLNPLDQRAYLLNLKRRRGAHA